MSPRSAAVAGALLAFGGAGSVGAQLRIVEWNVTNYASGRVAAFGTSIYGVNGANGLSMRPDVIIGQEFLSASGVSNFLNILNTAPGSPGDWAAAPFINGNDTDNAFFYRTSKVNFLGVTVVAVGGASPNHPRDLSRYDLRPVGYSAASATLACYSSHMKAGTGGSNEARRLLEAQRLRDDAQALPAEWNFLLGADLNIRSSSEGAYVEMVGSQANNAGRLFDPIARPGTWHNNSFHRFTHSQDPIGAGGMDDRYDQILVGASLIDGDGLDYVGDASIPYSASTWNDPNHSYRNWGNDGSSFNASLTTGGNTMVGSTIALALRDSAGNGGHLPVFLDLRVPAEIGGDTTLDLGTVEQASVAQITLSVGNAGNVALWTAEGIDDLDYTLAGSTGVTVPGGSFSDPAGGLGNLHVVEIDTSNAGAFNGTVTIESDSVDEPTRLVSVTAEITPVVSCPEDLDGSGDVGFSDILQVIGAWGPCGACPEDLNGSGTVGFDDILAVIAAWGDCD
jgi:hypothetical protein